MEKCGREPSQLDTPGDLCHPDAFDEYPVHSDARHFRCVVRAM